MNSEKMNEQSEVANVACAHRHVEYVGVYNALHRTHSDSWRCRDCRMRFAPIVSGRADQDEASEVRRLQLTTRWIDVMTHLSSAGIERPEELKEFILICKRLDE